MFHFNCENDDVDDLAVPSATSATATPTCSTPMEWVSLGGGIAFTAPGYPVERLCELLRALRERFGVQVYLEPGEACITSSAELVTTVLDVVHNEVDVAIVDASVEAHMPDHLIYATIAAGRRRPPPASTARSSPGARASPVTSSATTAWRRRPRSVTRSGSATRPGTRWSRRRGSTG